MAADDELTKPVDDVKLAEVMDELLKLSRRVEESAEDIKTIRGHLDAQRDT
jgi:hypothetical protein